MSVVAVTMLSRLRSPAALALLAMLALPFVLLARREKASSDPVNN